MSKTITNLIVMLGFITVVFGGYYLYTQHAATSSAPQVDAITKENMLKNTRAFIGYGETLERVDLKMEFLEDARFLSLRSYTTKIQESTPGRQNPFSEPSVGVVQEGQ
jgi:hypothetical protein